MQGPVARRSRDAHGGAIHAAVSNANTAATDRRGGGEGCGGRPRAAGMTLRSLEATQRGGRRRCCCCLRRHSALHDVRRAGDGVVPLVDGVDGGLVQALAVRALQLEGGRQDVLCIMMALLHK